MSARIARYNDLRESASKLLVEGVICNPFHEREYEFEETVCEMSLYCRGRTRPFCEAGELECLRSKIADW